MEFQRLIQAGSRALLLIAAGWWLAGIEARAGEAKKDDPKKTEAKGFFGSGADGANTTTGKVVSTAAASVKLSFDNQELAFYVQKNAKAVHATMAQLVPSDEITITWSEKNGRKWIQKIEGHGTVEGLVTAKTDAAIDVKPEKGDPQRLLFPRLSPPAEELSKLDQNTIKKIARVSVGDKARFSWQIAEGKRIVDVKYLAKAPAGKSPNATPPHHGPSPRSLLNRARRLGRL